jgi:hypothetical protein
MAGAEAPAIFACRKDSMMTLPKKCLNYRDSALLAEFFRVKSTTSLSI